MPSNQAYDSLELQDMALPYAPNAGYLINKPYLVSGSNTSVSWGGTLRKCPGELNLGLSATTPGATRLWVYETLEASPIVYMVGSYLSGVVYKLKYARLVGGDGAWHDADERRGSNHSALPHEGVVRRGKLYIKGFPSSGDDSSKLGSIYLDGTGGTMVTHDWGAIGPLVSVALTNPGGWDSSAHSVTVVASWGYVYTYQKVSGQETDQSPLQTNPDDDPSFTGPFTDLIPAMTVEGHADTTEYPYINMYRTTDGGGTFFFLKQISNTGTGSITFKDTYLASGSGNADPLPDSQLDMFHEAPSTTSNSPPPTVAPPLVTGTDSIQASTRLVVYAARIWYAVDEYLFYSANEELSEGIPEESYPSGEASPNFFRMNAAVTQLVPTPDGLMVMTRKDTTMIYGTSKATFNPLPFLGNIGACPNQNRAACTVSEAVAWVTHDYNVAMVRNGNFALLSKPLGNSIQNTVTAGALLDLQFWNQGDKEYLVCAAHRPDNTSLSQWFVYDLDRARRVSDDFWYPPWFKASTCLAVGESSFTSTDNKLFVSVADNATPINSLLCYIDPTGTTGSNIDPSTGTSTAFNWAFTSSLLEVPAGNHVNLLRRPYLSPGFACFEYERTMYSGDTDPVAQAYYDNFFTAPVALPTVDPPPRRPQSIGFKTCVLNAGANIVSKYVSLNLTGTLDKLQAEIHKVIWSWIPDSGA